VMGLASRAGYKRVFLNVPVRARANCAADVVGRIEVSPTDWPLEYHLKIRGAYQWLPIAIATKRRLLATLTLLYPTVVRRAARRAAPTPAAARSRVERSAL
jgi:hypothetical protein